MFKNPEIKSIVDIRDELQAIISITTEQASKSLLPVSGHVYPAFSNPFIDPSRLEQLKAIKSTDFDLSKLIEYCDELNICFNFECFLAVTMLCRSIMDHVPPIFGCKNFGEVANNYASGTKSFKESVGHLENSMRKIADSYLHVQVRKKEILPNRTQVNFSADFDVLLAEIVRVLS